MLTRQFREFERWADEQDKAKARKSTTQYDVSLKSVDLENYLTKRIS